MVLEAAAKTDKGAVIEMGRKEYWELGMDIDGDHRLGAWQIKEIIDLALQPGEKTRERFAAELPLDTKSAEIEVRITYYPSGTDKKGIEAQKVVKRLSFEK